ncbi:unnamed protein product [Didymodactylos carnosus]|uniref:NHL repeat-containing protein n=1 Tax=Didymodactylos carnosus TaxID=1234261 RepID=A0A815FHA7_9BILA|nr:unnamed protein product [Didymodactylos carnosus]CAF4171559.1 unnamed protein product [Didymodactylos carnosus]
MKWVEGAKQGIVVAGDQGEGNGLTQLSNPWGVVVDQLGTVYVADHDSYAANFMIPPSSDHFLDTLMQKILLAQCGCQKKG